MTPLSNYSSLIIFFCMSSLTMQGHVEQWIESAESEFLFVDPLAWTVLSVLLTLFFDEFKKNDYFFFSFRVSRMLEHNLIETIEEMTFWNLSSLTYL